MSCTPSTWKSSINYFGPVSVKQEEANKKLKEDSRPKSSGASVCACSRNEQNGRHGHVSKSKIKLVFSQSLM